MPSKCPTQNRRPYWLIAPLGLLVWVLVWEVTSNFKGKTAEINTSVEEQAPHTHPLDVFEAWLQLNGAQTAKGEVRVEQAVELAKQRRVRLLELIKSDPEAALAAAMPRAVHARMPAEVSQHLEQFVSMQAPLELKQSCFHPEGCTHAHEHDFYRATVMDGREVQVHAYGSRLNDLSIPATSIHGIVLDGHMAVSESRVRVLEPDESLPEGVRPPTPGSLAVEANGEIRFLASAGELESYEQTLRDEEENPVHIASDSGDGTSTISNRPSQSWANGDKKILVIMIDFSDLPGRPIQKSGSGIPAKDLPVTEDDIDALINGSNGVREFFQDGSFGSTDLLLTTPVAGDSPDVTEVLRVDRTASYYSNTGSSSALGTDARAAATAAGYNLDNYDRLCYMFTNLANFDGGTKFNGWGGRASVGGKNCWINGYWDFRVVAHELGHNWGLRHANLWKVTDGRPGSMFGSSQAYGDSHDTMGAASGSHTKHFSHWAKSLLWWIPDASVTTVDTSGVYRVYEFDDESADLNQARALKIVRDGTRDYWIGYRRNGTLGSMADRAYVLWGYNFGYDEGDLLDMNTPGSDVKDAGLAIGQTYEDPEKGISFTPIAQGGSGGNEWLDIQVTFSDGWPTAYAQWAAQSFTHPFTLNYPDDNPDGDAMTNLQEFAFGMDPTSPVGSALSFEMGGEVSQAGSPVLMNFADPGEEPDYRAVFLRRRDHVAAGLLYAADFSAELNQWTTSEATPTVLTDVEALGNMEAVSVSYPAMVPAHGDTENLIPRFFRVGVEMP